MTEWEKDPNKCKHILRVGVCIFIILLLLAYAHDIYYSGHI